MPHFRCGLLGSSVSTLPYLSLDPRSGLIDANDSEWAVSRRTHDSERSTVIHLPPQSYFFSLPIHSFFDLFGKLTIRARKSLYARAFIHVTDEPTIEQLEAGATQSAKDGAEKNPLLYSRRLSPLLDRTRSSGSPH